MISRGKIQLITFLAGLLFTSICFAATGDDLNQAFGVINGYLASVLFFDVLPGEGEIPFIVAWLIVGAIFLNFRMGVLRLSTMKHAVAVLRGKYHKPTDAGEVTPFQALTTALSATVGLGNIAGVAIAVSIGGPGAVFWMIVAGFLGMTSKFTEASLAQMYRETRPDGHVMGGAMVYLSKGFAEKGWVGVGKTLAILFAILTIGASLGGGNAFQVSQALSAVQSEVTFFNDNPAIFGIIMAIAVGVVIIGGIKRIAHVTEAVVPFMVLIYLAAASFIILSHASLVPDAISLIVNSAFSMEAGFGGLIGALVQGFKRAAFSSEAGIGSAAIAHSTAQTPYPVRQGIVALLEPFIDTVVICTMTALVIVITGVYNAPEHADLVANSQGAALTSAAFGSVIDWFPIILSVSVVLFAYSTMIAWSYYGERCWTYLFGEKGSLVYKLIFIAFIVIGSITSASNILDFSDLLLLGMAFPNFIGLYVLHGKVKVALREYLRKLKDGSLDKEAAN